MIVGIIGAMDIEVQALKNEMSEAKVNKVSGIDFYSGVINGVETVVATAGVGKVNAAVCTQTMILKYSPDMIINIGVAGGLHKDFSVGDIAIASSVVEHDMDTTALGEPAGFISGLNTVNIDCDKWLCEDLYEHSSKIEGITVKKGVIASGDQFISNDEARRRIVDNFNAIAAEMEGASIGHVCAMNNVRFGVLRAISDGANSNSDMDFPTFAKMAAEHSVKITLELLSRMR